jgi:hypothetical protein
MSLHTLRRRTKRGDTALYSGPVRGLWPARSVTARKWGATASPVVLSRDSCRFVRVGGRVKDQAIGLAGVAGAWRASLTRVAGSR